MSEGRIISGLWISSSSEEGAGEDETAAWYDEEASCARAGTAPPVIFIQKRKIYIATNSSGTQMTNYFTMCRDL